MEILGKLLLISYVSTPLIMLFFYVVDKFKIHWAGEVNIKSDIPIPIVAAVAWVFSPITIFILIYHIKINRIK